MLSAYQLWAYITLPHILSSLSWIQDKKKKSMNTQSTDENIFHQFQHEPFCLASEYGPYLHSKDSTNAFIICLHTYLWISTSKPKVSQSL